MFRGVDIVGTGISARLGEKRARQTDREKRTRRKRIKTYWIFARVPIRHHYCCANTSAFTKRSDFHREKRPPTKRVKFG